MLQRVRFNANKDLVNELRTTELAAIPDGSGSAHAPDVQEGWIRGLANRCLYHFHDSHFLDFYPLLREELRQLAAIRQRIVAQVLLNELRAGGALEKHKDAMVNLPGVERWHLPLVTNPDCSWWDEHHGHVHMEQFHWYGPVPFMGVFHAAYNRGVTSRLHIVADLMLDS